MLQRAPVVTDRSVRYSRAVPTARLGDVDELRAVAHELIEALRATGRDLHPGADFDRPATVALVLDEGQPVPDGAAALLAEFGGSTVRNRFPPYGRPGEIAYLIVTITSI